MSNTPLYYLDFTQCVLLEELYLDEVALTTLDLYYQQDNLRIVSCVNSSFNFISMQTCSKLEYVDITGCPVAGINFNYPPTTFICGNNIAQVYIDSDSYDLNYNGLIYPQRVSEVIGGDFDPDTGIVSNITGDQIEYTYECGDGLLRTFAISFKHL